MPPAPSKEPCSIPNHTLVLSAVSLFLTILLAVVAAENRFVHQEQYRLDMAQLRADQVRTADETRALLLQIHSEISALDLKIDAMNEKISRNSVILGQDMSSRKDR